MATDAGQPAQRDGGDGDVLSEHPKPSGQDVGVQGAPPTMVDGNGQSPPTPSPSTQCFLSLGEGGPFKVTLVDDPDMMWIGYCSADVKGQVPSHLHRMFMRRYRSRENKSREQLFAQCFVDLAEFYSSIGGWVASKVSIIHGKVEKKGHDGDTESLGFPGEEARGGRELSDLLFKQALHYFAKALTLSQLEDRDQALLKLALTYLRADRTSGAISSFQRFVSEYPNSRYIPWAYLALADLNYATGRWRMAEQSYSKVLASQYSPAAACATYKKAWAIYKQGYPHLARRAFFDCVEHLPRDTSAAGYLEACLRDAERLGFILNRLHLERPPR